MRTCIYFLVLFLLVGSKAHAANYFDFNFGNKISNYDNIVNVKMYYDLVGFVEAQFLVRPYIENGLVYILQEDTEEWISTNELWTSMPRLKRGFELKVIGGDIAAIGFRILNTVTNEIYDTPMKEMWLLSSFGDYLQRLNSNLTY